MHYDYSDELSFREKPIGVYLKTGDSYGVEDDDGDSCSCTSKHKQCYSGVNKRPFLSVCNCETIIYIRTTNSESRKLTYTMTLRKLLAFQNRKIKYYCRHECKEKV